MNASRLELCLCVEWRISIKTLKLKLAWCKNQSVYVDILFNFYFIITFHSYVWWYVISVSPFYFYFRITRWDWTLHNRVSFTDYLFEKTFESLTAPLFTYLSRSASQSFRVGLFVFFQVIRYQLRHLENESFLWSGQGFATIKAGRPAKALPSVQTKGIVGFMKTTQVRMMCCLIRTHTRAFMDALLCVHAIR